MVEKRLLSQLNNNNKGIKKIQGKPIMLPICSTFPAGKASSELLDYYLQ